MKRLPCLSMAYLHMNKNGVQYMLNSNSYFMYLCTYMFSDLLGSIIYVTITLYAVLSRGRAVQVLLNANERCS